MCGIAGIISLNDKPVDLQILRSMTDAIAHRGPDGEGHWISLDGSIGFGHRRLSIIDLSNDGSQPMHYLNNRYTIIFNGEIYNYLEIRTSLQKEGYQFRSNSDTEVLLALYDSKKSRCVDDLDGMFAFAIWDEFEKKLFCARDRFGEKPFYYRFKDNVFIFASEIKALKKFDSKILPDTDILQFHITSGQRFDDSQTIFSDIIPLMPSTTLELYDGRLKLNKYWDIQLEEHTEFMNPGEAFSEFERLFTISLKRRLRSDVPYGSSLSGGLDSSTIVGFISAIAGGDFKTFSARFQGPKDEGKWIAEVVSMHQVRNFTVSPDPVMMMDELAQILHHHEYPIASSSIYAQWCVMRLAHEHNVKVLLDGQGADEYLAGYDELKYFAIWELFRSGKFSTFLHERNLFNKNYGLHGSIGWSFLADPLLSLLGKKRSVFKNGYTLKEQLKFYTKNQLGELLRYADRNSMAHSVEVRLPFLSHELVEFVFKLPIDLIYHDGKTKYILREAAKQNLPKAIYNRTDKIGFAPPQDSWMQLPASQKKVVEMESVLRDFNINPGKDSFRNLVAGELLKQFV